MQDTVGLREAFLRWAVCMTLLLEFFATPVVEIEATGTAWMVYVHGWHAEGLERERGHLFNTGFWVGEVLLRTGIAAVTPDLLHVLPLGDIGYFRIRMPLLLWALSSM